jgi:hypothetical protein
MRFYIRLFLFLLMAAALIWAWEKVRHLNPLRSENQTEHNVVLKEIVALGKMELVKYHFRDIVEHEVVKPLLPNAKALLIVTGEVIGCIDLTKVKTEDFHVQADTLVITLPQPELCVTSIDHSKSKVYNTEFALFEEGQLVDDAYKQAETQLQKSAQEMNILPETKTNAEKILKPFLEKIAGKKVKLVYKN